MSGPRRAYDLLRGYVNREWDRIKGIDWDWTEAKEELSSTPPQPGEPSKPLPELPAVSPEDAATTARSVLGVPKEASFEEIRKSFEKLNDRSDPSKFPEGSSEQVHAAQIRVRVQWAYTVLTEHISNTEKRFKSLEIE